MGGFAGLLCSSSPFVSRFWGLRWCDFLFRDLVQEAKDISVQLTLFSYTAAISVCERAGQWQKGLWILESMCASMIQADTVAYNSAIASCGNAGQWEWAIALFVKLGDQGLQCNIITCNSVISAYEKCVYWTAAVDCFEELQLQHLRADVISYNSMITALTAALQWQSAMQMPLTRILICLFDSEVLPEFLECSLPDTSGTRAQASRSAKWTPSTDGGHLQCGHEGLRSSRLLGRGPPTLSPVLARERAGESEPRLPPNQPNSLDSLVTSPLRIFAPIL